AALPNVLVQEHNEVNNQRAGGRTLIGAGYFREPFVLDDEGCAAVPRGPGLGVELDEAGMAAIMARPWRSRRGWAGRREPAGAGGVESGAAGAESGAAGAESGAAGPPVPDPAALQWTREARGLVVEPAADLGPHRPGATRAAP